MIDTLMLIGDPLDAEAATAYLLRSFAANRVSPRSVYRWLGLRWTDDLKHEHLEILSHVTGAPLAWLRPRVPASVPGDRWRRSWCGQLWRNPATVRTRQFQVCAFCLHAEGTCRLEWDLACFIACPIHGAILTDRCAHCGHYIHWQRPAVDVCSCKRHLRALHAPLENFQPLLRAWLLWVTQCLGDRLGGPPLPADLKALFPGNPSIDGMWRVIHAFGIRPEQLDDGTTSPDRRELSPVETYRIAELGFQRLHRMREGANVTQGVHVGALRWQTLQGVTVSDRALASHLLTRVDAGKTLELKGKPRKGNQLELFS